MLFFFAVAVVAAAFFVFVIPLLRVWWKRSQEAYKQEEDALGIGDKPDPNKKAKK
jgi:hypothetical protein